MADNNNLGKKVFFLYPHSVIQEELVEQMLDDEYEVYLLKDYRDAMEIFKKNPGSICFINIDEGLKEKEWEAFVRDLVTEKETSGILVGILSYNSDKDLMQKYLLDVGVQCGYIQLKLGMEESAAIFRKALVANEARGRRRYVRAICEHDPLSQLNITTATGTRIGNIMDISSVGISCTFEDDPELTKNTLLNNMQLVLRGARVTTEGVVFGFRENGSKRYVVLFKGLSIDAKKKVRKYIYITLQQSIDV